MDQVASMLGIPLPLSRARDLIMKQETRCRPTVSKRQRPRGNDSNSVILCPRHQFLQKHTPTKDNDDDTASTVSTETSLDDQILTTGSVVTFAEPLVTQIIARPITDQLEKGNLYYLDRDFKKFRQESRKCLKGGGARRHPKVQFSNTPVTKVHVYSQIVVERETLFYSELDIKRYVLYYFCTFSHTKTAGFRGRPVNEPANFIWLNRSTFVLFQISR